MQKSGGLWLCEEQMDLETYYNLVKQGAKDQFDQVLYKKDNSIHEIFVNTGSWRRIEIKFYTNPKKVV